MSRTVLFKLLMPLFFVLLVACSSGAQHKPALTVYKSPTCGCCKAWIKHLEEAGFENTVHNMSNLSELKADKGIAPEYQSCHTAVSGEGYVFEGHVPARYIEQFLTNPPQDALGLAVPGMPVGSPGMEMGERFSPYQVLLLKRDGSTQVFADITEPGNDADE